MSPTAIMANMLAADEPVARLTIEAYFNKLRHVKTALSGGDLLNLGVPQGPKVKEVLWKLLAARLDGELKSKAEEVEWVKRFY
jgi:tRNA nucleotidyltransferase (CCA-adding enzyme)